MELNKQNWAILTSLESLFHILSNHHFGSRWPRFSRNIHFDKLTLEDEKGSKKIFNRGFFGGRKRVIMCRHKHSHFYGDYGE